MMSVPVAKPVLTTPSPPAAATNQAQKVSPSSTNPVPAPLSLTVPPPKISILPPPLMTHSTTNKPAGLNHSAPLSLVHENKVNSNQIAPAINKTPEKVKEPAQIKPTSNGDVSPNKSLPSPVPAPPVVAETKPEEAATETVNHTNEAKPEKESATPTKVEAEVPTTQPQQPNVIDTQNKPEVKETTNNDTNTSPKKQQTNETKPVIEAKPAPKPDIKVATVPQANKRKREEKPKAAGETVNTSVQDNETKPKRMRSQVLPYQSPIPEFTTLINKSLKDKDTPTKASDEKLIVFYKNEFLAVRNDAGGFYVCQTLQNIFKSSHRIRIRWLSEEGKENSDVYSPDFYDTTEFECILTSIVLKKFNKNKYKLPKDELDRIQNILHRALDVEKGVVEKPSITEEHPDGLDLSLFKDESQLKQAKKPSKRKHSPSDKKKKKKKSAKKAKKEPTTQSASASVNKKDKSQTVSKKESDRTTAMTSSGRSARNKSYTEPAPQQLSASKSKKAMKKGSSIKSKDRGSKKKSDSVTTPERSTGRDRSSKAVDPLKTSPPNEKARVVAKVLRKADIISGPEVSSKNQTKDKKKGNTSSKAGSSGGVKKAAPPATTGTRSSERRQSNNLKKTKK